MDCRQALDTLSRDPYFSQAPEASAALGALHVQHRLPPAAIKALAELPRDELCVRLRAHMQRAHPGMPSEQVRKRAAYGQESLEAAMLRQMDKMLGEHAAGQLRIAAAEIRRIASCADLSLMQICQAMEQDPESRQAVLESLLGDERLAEGLTIHLQNNPQGLVKQLSAGRRVALPQSTVTLQQLQQAMLRTADQLDGLARRLNQRKARQGVDCIDLCPDLAQGLLLRLEPDSCLAQAIAKRQKAHRRYQAWDRGVKMAGSLLLDIGASFVPMLSLAGAAYNLGFAAADSRKAEKEGRLRLLGALAAGSGPQRQRQIQTRRNRERGQAVFGMNSSSLPGNSYVSELAFGAGSPSDMRLNRSAGGPPGSRSGRPAGNPAR